MLKDKVAIVTGAAQGIGFGIVKKFIENGCKAIVNTYHDIEEYENGASNMKVLDDMGAEYIVVKADVSKKDQVVDMVQKAIDTFGSIDILVNNAAFATPPKSILDVPEEEWNQSLAVNLTGPFLMCKHVLPHMVEARYGKIINISAVSSLVPLMPDVHYNSTKAALNTFSQDIALEFAPLNITVNVICPGIIVTELVKSIIPEGMEESAFFETFGKSTSPMQRVGYPDDIAHMALFLASDASSYITGQIITVGGGLPLHRSGPPGV